MRSLRSSGIPKGSERSIRSASVRLRSECPARSFFTIWFVPREFSQISRASASTVSS